MRISIIRCHHRYTKLPRPHATFWELKHYPVFLDLKDRPVLVVGAGKVALRKTRGLVEAGARITVVAPECEPEFEDLPVRLGRRGFRASDMANALLVFAAIGRAAGRGPVGTKWV